MSDHTKVRTREGVVMDLAKAETRLKNLQAAFDNYSGNNPNKGMSESRDAADEVRYFRDELDRMDKASKPQP